MNVIDNARSAEPIDSSDEIIVVLGNGLDLECGLPTKYGDFIHFVSCLEERWIESADPKLRRLHPQLRRELELRQPRGDWESVFGNYWYRHFKDLNSELGWVDFEGEVARIVGSVEDAMLHLARGRVQDLSDEVTCERGSLLDDIIRDTKFSAWIMRGSLITIARFLGLGILILILTITLLILISGLNRPFYFFRYVLYFIEVNLDNGSIGLLILMFFILILPMIVALYREYRIKKKRNPKLAFKPFLNRFLKYLIASFKPYSQTSYIKRRTVKHSGVKLTIYGGLRYGDLRDYLLGDFDAFVRGFETYLRDYVERIKPQRTQAVEELLEAAFGARRAPRILSFNYTSTFQRLAMQRGYGDDAYQVCHIHGVLGDGTDRNRMVLGIDERLSPEEQERLIAFAPFRKYYQRIYKETDNSYIEWLRDIKRMTFDEDRHRVRVLVFGHSLGVTDKDALVPFLTLGNSAASIYYHDQDAFGDLVANLTGLLGMDEVIKYTGGPDAQIRFVEQPKRLEGIGGTNKDACLSPDVTA